MSHFLIWRSLTIPCLSLFLQKNSQIDASSRAIAVFDLFSLFAETFQSIADYGNWNLTLISVLFRFPVLMYSRKITINNLPYGCIIHNHPVWSNNDKFFPIFNEEYSPWMTWHFFGLDSDTYSESLSTSSISSFFASSLNLLNPVRSTDSGM